MPVRWLSTSTRLRIHPQISLAAITRFQHSQIRKWFTWSIIYRPQNCNLILFVTGLAKSALCLIRINALNAGALPVTMRMLILLSCLRQGTVIIQPAFSSVLLLTPQTPHGQKTLIAFVTLVTIRARIVMKSLFSTALSAMLQNMHSVTSLSNGVRKSVVSVGIPTLMTPV